MPACTHQNQIKITEPTGDIAGCEACLASGGQWVHLRMCLSCEKVGCCDSSPGRHAAAHAAADGHPLIRSVEPGDDWCWCAIDELYFRLGAA